LVQLLLGRSGVKVRWVLHAIIGDTRGHSCAMPFSSLSVLPYIRLMDLNGWPISLISSRHRATQREACLLTCGFSCCETCGVPLSHPPFSDLDGRLVSPCRQYSCTTPLQRGKPNMS
jgi:hypothetical protein